MGIAGLVGKIDSDYLEELELLLYNGGREGGVWNLGDSSRYPSVLLCLVTTIEG